MSRLESYKLRIAFGKLEMMSQFCRILPLWRTLILAVPWDNSKSCNEIALLLNCLLERMGSEVSCFGRVRVLTQVINPKTMNSLKKSYPNYWNDNLVPKINSLFRLIHDKSNRFVFLICFIKYLNIDCDLIFNVRRLNWVSRVLKCAKFHAMCSSWCRIASCATRACPQVLLIVGYWREITGTTKTLRISELSTIVVILPPTSWSCWCEGVLAGEHIWRDHLFVSLIVEVL